MDMKDKVVIVAGGARDLGKACSLKLASQGAKVVIGYYGSAERAEETLNEIKAAGGNAIAVKANLTEDADVAKLVDEAKAAYGDVIDSLIFVTGGLVERRKIGEMDRAFWSKVFDLNMTSLFLTAQAVIPHMPEGGSIVCFASQAGRDGGGAGSLAYASSKGAVMTFARGLAKELGPKIRVNAICAGMFSTTFHDTFTTDEVRAKVADMCPVKREGRPEEAANLAVFLASSQSGYMTGTCIDINGGILFS